MNLYNNLAEEYDQIVATGTRAKAVADFVDALLQRGTFGTVLDVACGTGLYAREFARCGLTVTGADLSAGLLEAAQNQSQTEDTMIQWREIDMRALGGVRELSAAFDLLVCMGNSIPHLQEQKDLTKTIVGFREVLRPGGLVVIHLLNYARILERRERFVGATRENERTYVRFYDFLDTGLLRFNILQLDWHQSERHGQLHSMLLRPWKPADLRKTLSENGFESIEQYAGLQFSPFREDESETVLLLARRGINP
jgi:SAM-dependent methyltransferase